MAKPLGAPSWMGRAEWRVQVFCPQDKTLAQAEFTSAEHFKIAGFPRRTLVLWGGFAMVDVGDNGNISQFFVPHTSHFLLHAIKTAPARPLCFNAPEPGSAAPTAEPGAYISPLISVQTLYYTALC